ncbi:MAG TPA: hypothetical protein VEC09_00870 [Actinomycetota bacterium]|nr:hypothetical protein [Actinomycetota bacterium]
MPRLSLSTLATLYAIPAWVIGAAVAVRALEPFPSRAMYAVTFVGWIALLPITLNAERIARVLDVSGRPRRRRPLPGNRDLGRPRARRSGRAHAAAVVAAV